MKHTLFFLCLLFLLCLRPIYGSVVTISVGENLLFDELLTTINHRLNESKLLDSIHSLNDRGNNFQAHFQYQSAVEAHFKAMEYAQASQDTSLLICTLNHIGTDLRLAGAPMQSARYHQHALALSKQAPYDMESRVNTMEQLGLVYLSLREYKRALTLFQTGYALVDSMHLETHRARAIMDRYYGYGVSNAYLGDEDQGQMSAWFLMSALGLFQTDGGCSVDPIYELGSPLYQKVVIDLGQRFGRGSKLVIEAHHASRLNMYIQSVKLNGKPWNDFKIPAHELLKGGHLVLEMGPQPQPNFGLGND